MAQVDQQSSAFFQDVAVRFGKNSALPIKHLDSDEVLGEAELSLSGNICGKFPATASLTLTHQVRSGKPWPVPVPEVTRGRFATTFLLRHGLNRFCLTLADPDGESLAVETFSVTYKSSFREWNETVFIAFFLALMIRSLVLQAFWIPTGSMEPTLLGEKHVETPVDGRMVRQRVRSGDRILVNRFAYVADLSLDGRIPFLPRFTLAAPKRGDIIVFKYPDKDPANPPRDFIKRVIGLPNDEIRISDGHVFVNGRPLTEPYISEPPVFDFAAVVVPPDALFVMGDNRNNSADSRYWGFMPLANLKGQAVFAYLPMNRIHPIRSHSHAGLVPGERYLPEAPEPYEE